MDHNQAKDSQSAELRKSNIGVILTIVYAVIYGGFVFLSVFYPTLMGSQTFSGMNLAITYGLGLIIVAIILAMIYNQMVRTRPAGNDARNTPETDQSEWEN